MPIDRRYLIIGGVVVAAGGLWWYEKNKAANASTASSSTGSAYGPPLPGGGLLGPIYSPVNITNQLPAPGKVAPPPPIKPTPTSAVSPTALESILDQIVGTLSDTSGKNASPSQISQFFAQGHKMRLSGVPLRYYVQTQNIGVVSQGMHVPTPAAITSLAETLAGGVKTYQSLPALQRNQYGEIANVELLQQMNSGK